MVTKIVKEVAKAAAIVLAYSAAKQVYSNIKGKHSSAGWCTTKTMSDKFNKAKEEK